MCQALCWLPGINCKSNHTARGLENRAVYAKLLKLMGGIVTNEMVVCRDGFGKLVSESEDLLTISLELWQFEKTYTASLGTEGEMSTAHEHARLVWWEPSLDEYQREERYGTVLAESKEAIETCHRSHNHTLPNCKDRARQQHPRYLQTRDRVTSQVGWAEQHPNQIGKMLASGRTIIW